jgi:hypothetical protein
LHFPDVDHGPDVPAGVVAWPGIKAVVLAPMIWEDKGIGAIRRA